MRKVSEKGMMPIQRRTDLGCLFLYAQHVSTRVRSPSELRVPGRPKRTIISFGDGEIIGNCGECVWDVVNRLTKENYVVGSAMGERFIEPEYEGNFLDVSLESERSKMGLDNLLILQSLQQAKRTSDLTSQQVQKYCGVLLKEIEKIEYKNNPSGEQKLLTLCEVGLGIADAFYGERPPIYVKDLKD